MTRGVLFFGFLVVACSNGGNQPCTLTQVGSSCLNDVECCTGFCQLEGEGGVEVDQLGLVAAHRKPRQRSSPHRKRARPLRM